MKEGDGFWSNPITIPVRESANMPENMIRPNTTLQKIKFVRQEDALNHIMINHHRPCSSNEKCDHVTIQDGGYRDQVAAVVAYLLLTSIFRETSFLWTSYMAALITLSNSIYPNRSG